MHVDWCWIKQRPHFLAEELSLVFDVLVLYPRANYRSYLVKNETDLRTVPILQLPFSRFEFVASLNKYIRGTYFWLLMLFYKPEVVWFTFPTVVPQGVLSKFKKSVVVYDCMDDASQFTSSVNKKLQMLDNERALIERADVVLVSSKNLHDKAMARGGAPHNISLVRNAYECAGEVITHPPLPECSTRTYKILYIGTIADYMDFDTLLYCVQEIDWVEFHFIGPVSTHVPAHPRFKFHGSVAHSRLREIVRPYDCFIMPFIANELIQGVDPVKLYEYIDFHKNILCCHYPEIDRFDEFVLFYEDKGDLAKLITALRDDGKIRYSPVQRQVFLQANTWSERVKAITEILNARLRAQFADVG